MFPIPILFNTKGNYINVPIPLFKTKFFHSFANKPFCELPLSDSKILTSGNYFLNPKT